MIAAIDCDVYQALYQHDIEFWTRELFVNSYEEFVASIKQAFPDETGLCYDSDNRIIVDCAFFDELADRLDATIYIYNAEHDNLQILDIIHNTKYRENETTIIDLFFIPSQLKFDTHELRGTDIRWNQLKNN